MRQSEFDSRKSATLMLLIANAVAFVLECLRYGYHPQFSSGDYLALSWDGLKHGYIWELLSFQFLHAGLFHLIVNCWAIFAFGREVEIAIGARRFLVLYFGSGVIGGLFQAFAGSLSQVFTHSEWAKAFAGPTVGALGRGTGLGGCLCNFVPGKNSDLVALLRHPRDHARKVLAAVLGAILNFRDFVPRQHRNGRGRRSSRWNAHGYFLRPLCVAMELSLADP